MELECTPSLYLSPAERGRDYRHPFAFEVAYDHASQLRRQDHMDG